jgi:hypothetical protein
VAGLLTLDDFSPAVGDGFRLPVEGDPVELELVEARSLGDRPLGDRLPFALLFRGPGEPALEQATYRLVHDRLGELEIFIVPVAATADGRDYEAIFT